MEIFFEILLKDYFGRLFSEDLVEIFPELLKN
jgi:hypothetical protein